MKVCKSCGKEFRGEFCEHCGYGDPNLKTKAANKYKKNTTPVRFMTPEQKEEYYAELRAKEEERRKTGKNKHDPKQLRLLIVVAVAAAVLIFGTLFGTGALGINEKNTDVVEKYLTAIKEENFDDYVSCFPKEMRNDYEDDLDASGYSKKEYMQAFNADFAEEYGDDFTIEYSIVDTDTITEYSLDSYEELYGTVPTIKEACIVSTDVTFTGSLGSETFRMSCYVGKVGRHWKLFNMEYDAGIITTDMEIDNIPESSQTDENSSADDIEEQSETGTEA